MASILKDAQIFFDKYNLTGYSNNVALNYGVEAKDATVFGNTTRLNAAGLYTVSAGVDGFWNATPDAGLFANMGLSDKPFSVIPGGAAGGVAYFFNAVEGKYTLGGTIGELVNFQAEAHARTALARGLCLYTGSATSSSTSTKYVLGARSATQTLYAALHVYSVSGTSPTLDVLVESDANASAGGEVTQITFTQATTTGSQWQTDTGAVTDTYYRINYTIGGSDTPTFGFAVVVGII